MILMSQVIPELFSSPSAFVPALLSNFPVILLAEGGLHPAIPKAVNLALFVTLLWLAVRKPAREFFSTRFAMVRETLQRAAKEKEAAAAKMAELDLRLSRLDTEIAGIREQAGKEADAERERLQNEARRDVEKIGVMAKRDIEAAKQIAMADLRDFAAAKAVDLAEQMIRREMKPEDDMKLLQRMTEQMNKAEQMNKIG